MDCRIPADPDILGLGVRLGVYFQFVSNILIILINVEEAVSSLLVSGILFTGIFIAELYNLRITNPPPSSTITLEWFLLLDFQLLIPIIMIGERVKTRQRISFGLLTLFLFRYLAWNTLNLWFWFHGLTVENKDQCMEPRVFFFGNFGAYGNIRSAFKAFTIMGAIGFPGLLVWWFISLLQRIFDADIPRGERWKVKLPKYFEAINALFGDDEGGSVFIYHFVSTIWGLVYCIVAIELEIRWNNLDGIGGVSTTGQIIPLVVGCLSLARSIALVIGHWINGGGEDGEEEQ